MRRHVLPSLLSAPSQDNLRQVRRTCAWSRPARATIPERQGRARTCRTRCVSCAFVFANRDTQATRCIPYGELRQAVQHLLQSARATRSSSRARGAARISRGCIRRELSRLDRDGSPVRLRRSCASRRSPATMGPCRSRLRSLASTCAPCTPTASMAPSYTPVPTLPGAAGRRRADGRHRGRAGRQTVAEFLRQKTGAQADTVSAELFEVYRGEHLPAGKKSPQLHGDARAPTTAHCPTRTRASSSTRCGKNCSADRRRAARLISGACGTRRDWPTPAW